MPAEENNCSSGPTIVEGEQSLVFWTEIAASLAGSLPALAYVVILVITKAYREFTRRLSLYLALTALLLAATWPNWSGRGPALHTSILLQGVLQLYAGLAFGLVATLASAYVFAIAVLKVEQSVKHEVAGLVVVFVGPLFVCWVASLSFCAREHWTVAAAFASVVLVQFIVSNAALVAVVLRLLRRIVSDREAFLYEHHKKALKKVLPLFSCVFCMQIPTSVVVAYCIYLTTLDDAAGVSLAASEAVALVPCWSAVLPLLLVCDPVFRPCRASSRNANNDDRSRVMNKNEAAFVMGNSLSGEDFGAEYVSEGSSGQG